MAGTIWKKREKITMARRVRKDSEPKLNRRHTEEHTAAPPGSAPGAKSLNDVTVPFIQGEMGDVPFYLLTLTLGEVARRLVYPGDGEEKKAPEEKYQRNLNRGRVQNSLVPYLDKENHFFPSLVATCDASDITVDHRSAKITLPAGKVLHTLDGQHRLCAIQSKLAGEMDEDDRQAFENESIAVTLLPSLTLANRQQLFSDLNRNQKLPPKALGILFDQRDVFAVVARLVAKTGIFKGRVNLEGNVLSKRSPFIITLAMMYEVVKPFMVTNPGSRTTALELRPDLANETPEAISEEIADILEHTIFDQLPEAERIRTISNAMASMRGVYVCYTSLGWQSMARATAKALEFNVSEDDIKARLRAIDWKLTAPMWRNIVSNGKVLVRRDSIELAVGIIEQALTASAGSRVLRRRRGVVTPVEEHNGDNGG